MNKEKVTNEELAKRARSGDLKARDELVLNNFGLVHTVAKKMVPISKSLDYEDLVSEGAIGLIKAVDNFDTTGKGKFSTYATACIKRNISRAINSQDLAIRVPEYALLKQEELQSLDVKNAKQVLSLDYLRDNENSAVQVADKDFDVFEDAYKSELKKDVEEVLSEYLTDIQKSVFCYYFGLSGNESKTAEEISKILNVPRNEVFNSIARGMKTLRNPLISRKLKSYYEFC